MSFDLMVFDLENAPKNRQEFVAWYEVQTNWSKVETSFDSKIASPTLQEWFQKIADKYPPMNGPLAPDGDDIENLADYTITQNIIYAAFSWDNAEGAYSLAKELASELNVGFYDVSSPNGEIILGNISINEETPNKEWWKFW